MKTILIAGGSGLVGRHLTNQLLAQGHQVRWLSRKGRSGRIPSYRWDLGEGYIDEKAFDEVNVIINLAGAGIAVKKWSIARKNMLIESRVQCIQLLENYIKGLDLKLDLYINASAIGYYGDQSDHFCTENSKPGKGFLSQCCVQWEQAVEKMQIPCPKVIIRIGIVLSTQGGALKKMLLPLKMRANIYFGDGQQWMSWVHIGDLCGMLGYLIDEKSLDSLESLKTEGAIKLNAVADNPMCNKDFVQEMAKGMDISAVLLPVPIFVLRLAMGEMADIFLESTRVSNKKIKDLGFEFVFSNVSKAVSDLRVIANLMR